MSGISLVIISYNEECNIARCVKSVLGIADEIIVVDSYSTDKTEEICRGLGVDFYKHLFEGLYNRILEIKVDTFSTIAAKEYYNMGRKTTIASMLVHGFWRFCKTYLLRLGFLDGFNGFVISSLSAYTTFLKYMKLRQLNIAARKADRSNKNWFSNPVIGNEGRLFPSKERHLSDAS